MILKTTLFLASLCLFFAGCKNGGQNQDSGADANTSGTETLKGKIVQKPWTKSIESYCAQGSEYFVLETGDKSHVLQTAEGLGVDFKSFEGKEVNLEGKFIVKTISSEEKEGEVSQKPMDTPPFIEQKPMNGGGPEGGKAEADFTCEVFEVSKIS